VTPSNIKADNLTLVYKLDLHLYTSRLCIYFIIEESNKVCKNNGFEMLTSSVYHGLPETRGVSEMGHAGTGTVLDFGTPRHTVYPCRGVAGIHGYISKNMCQWGSHLVSCSQPIRDGR
jgi:hypothetical protein